jgi:type IV pilus assembly protein PilV
MKQRILVKRETRGVLRHGCSRCPKKQSGFTLIEVLVSAVVLAVGLIGVAGMQALSLNQNQSSFMRSQATALAYDLADRMRSNVSGANANFYDPGSAGFTGGCITTTGCTTQQLAENDLAEWNAAITTYLPMGEGFVCIDSTPDDGTEFSDPQCDGTGTQFAVKIWWDDDRDGTINMIATNTERFVITYQL